jgi:putative peptide zinc metalloprotease protein
VVVFSAIILFLGGKLFTVGVLFAVIMAATWVLVPAGKVIRYLTTSPELDRVRVRAAVTSLAAVLCLVIGVGLISVPDRPRIEGVVEPCELALVHMETAGFVDSFLDSGAKIEPDGPPLIEASSPELEAQRGQLAAEFRRLQVNRQFAQTQEAAATQIMEEKISALEEQIERNNQDLRALALRSPISGTWVAPDIDRIRGAYLSRGHYIGVAANLDRLRIRAIAGQTVAARLIKEAQPAVEIKVRGQPDIEVVGRIETIIPAGHEQLPSAALGYAAGGSTQIDLEDPSGRQAAEPFFEILVIPFFQEPNSVRPGQTVLLRFETSPKPLLVQGYRSLLQLFQRRFQV